MAEHLPGLSDGNRQTATKRCPLPVNAERATGKARRVKRLESSHRLE